MIGTSNIFVCVQVRHFFRLNQEKNYHDLSLNIAFLLIGHEFPARSEMDMAHFEISFLNIGCLDERYPK
jgi:hypothetical protein